MFDETITRLRDLLDDAKNITVVIAQNPSLDTMAAGLSLLLALEKDGKKVNAICTTTPTVAFGNLVGVNKVKGYQGGSAQGLVISLPYRTGAIEKISYDIIGDRINLTVVPGPDGLQFTTDEIDYQLPSLNTDMIIAVGIAQEGQVGEVLMDNPEAAVVNIDTSMDNTGYGTLALVDTSFSSISEMVTKLLTALGISLDSDIAQNLLSGIVFATGNFQKSNTSAYAFQTVGMLMQKGARRSPLALDERMGEEAFGKKPTTFGEDLTFGQADMQSFGSNQSTGAYGSRNMYTPQQLQTKRPGASALRRGGAMPQFKRFSPTGAKNAPVAGAKQQNKQTPAPKDWLAPKIYRGSTPIS